MPPAKLSRLGTALAVGIPFVLACSARGDVQLPAGVSVRQVDFERHVMGVFGRMGCNAGSCHGSFQGKGGFRLSLFGYDPEMDYLALTRDVLGRRVDRVEPDRSLVLLKPTGQVNHGGGRRFDKNSWQYRLLRDWIAAGTPWKKGSGDVAALVVTPPEYAFRQAGDTGQITVKARYADGSEENVTPLCDFRVHDDAVAEVTNLGAVKALQPGDTALIVSYRGNIVPVRILVPVQAAAGFRYPKLPEVNYADREVFAKLKRLNIVPSELADDLEFLRRVSIDTIGSLPSPDEVRAFVQDSSPDKRTRKIEELLAHPLHAALWATKLCDVTGNNTDSLENPQDMRAKRSQMWFDWIRRRVADNVPYDEIVRGILCATSRDGQEPEEWLKRVKTIEAELEKGFDTDYPKKPTLDLFWRRQQKVQIEQWGEKTAAAFLGVRLECAQCHKHPFDRWTQADYRSYANVFGQVAFGISNEAKKCIDAENNERRKQADKKKQQNLVREMFLADRPQLLGNPDGSKGALPAKALGGPEIPLEKGKDARVALFEWMRSPDNPFFARAFVNRVWGHYFGTGLVDPVDDFSLANPPSNPKLLDALAKDFIDHHFDIRHLERVILNSRTYQLSAIPNATNRLDRTNYSHSQVRRLMAEVVVDVLDSALGVTEGSSKAREVRPGSRAIEVGSTRVQDANLAYVFRTFGRPPRSTACDCERAMEPALPQTLFLMTDPFLLGKIQSPKGRLQQLLQSKKDDGLVLEELFLATLTRFPTDKEKERFAAYRAKRPERQAAFVDTVWALINTREFITNH